MGRLIRRTESWGALKGGLAGGFGSCNSYLDQGTGCRRASRRNSARLKYVHFTSKISEIACAAVVLVHDVGVKWDAMPLLTGRIAANLLRLSMTELVGSSVTPMLAISVRPRS